MSEEFEVGRLAMFMYRIGLLSMSDALGFDVDMNQLLKHRDQINEWLEDDWGFHDE